MADDRKITVLGAGGYTGRFVVETLRSRAVTVLPATRSGNYPSQDQDAEVCAAIDFAQPDSLDRAVANADAVINCAGPFFDTAEPAVAAAVRAGIPYLDLTAEQTTALRLFELFDGPAKEAHITVVPAMAFYGGLGDLLVSALAAGRTNADEIEIAVGLDRWIPTEGTRRTGERNTYERLIVRGGRLVPVPAPPPAKAWDFPAPFGEQQVTCVALSEVVLISRHIAAQSVTHFINLKPLEDLRNPQTPTLQSQASGARSPQRFVIEARVTTGGQTLRATASGQDIYAVSAPLIVNACLEILAGQSTLTGVRTPGELFEPHVFLAGLSPEIEVQYPAPMPP